MSDGDGCFNLRTQHHVQGAEKRFVKILSQLSSIPCRQCYTRSLKRVNLLASSSQCSLAYFFGGIQNPFESRQIPTSRSKTVYMYFR